MYLQSVKDLTAQNYVTKSNKTFGVVGKLEKKDCYLSFVDDAEKGNLHFLYII